MEKEKAQFKVLQNGPLQVSGNFELYSADGDYITKEGPVFLCRCGMSSDKPFCDGSHKQANFNG